MENIREIIVPVDFYQHTDDLAGFAIGIARKLEGKITFVHVAENILVDSLLNPESYKKLDATIRDHAESKMASLLEKTREACPACSGVVLRGDTVDGIIKYVEDMRIDLIIMGTHGARGIEKILLGSVAERVLKRVSCPTLVFNPYRGERGYQISSSIKESVLPV